MAILKTCGNAHFEVGQRNGAKDEALPGRPLQTRFGLEDGGILVERSAEDLLKSHRDGRMRERRDQN
jgi:hypothetical protein